MKTYENVIVYKCDFCEKKLFRKHAMMMHEKKCSANPLNIRACFNCINLEKVDIEYEGFNDVMLKSTCFRCKELKTFMFPPKLEHQGQGIPPYTTFEGEEILQDKMPLECEKFTQFNF